MSRRCRFFTICGSNVPLRIPRHLDTHFPRRVRHHRFRPAAVANIRRLPARLSLVLLVTEVLGHLFNQRGFQHILG